jgi:hypothetical protein
MPNKIIAPFLDIAILALGLALVASPAYAGFQWVPSNGGAETYAPPEASIYTAPPVPLQTAPQAATNAPEIISPVIISGDAKPVQATAPSYQPSQPVVLTMAPSSPEPAPKEEARPDLATATISVSPTPSVSPSVGAEVVQGFASNVPLALALRQVLPIGYSFSIDQGVDMDTLVSYKGGKPWGETLKSMLAPAGLVGREQGTVVTVSRAIAPVVSMSPSLPAQPRTIRPLSVLVPPAEMPVVNVIPTEGWTADRGDTLRKVLTNWCHRSGTEIQWLAEYDYPIEASAHFSGGFEDAVRNLLAGFDGARPQPIGELHTNTGAGQMVLVVQARGNSYSN